MKYEITLEVADHLGPDWLCRDNFANIIYDHLSVSRGHVKIIKYEREEAQKERFVCDNCRKDKHESPNYLNRADHFFYLDDSKEYRSSWQVCKECYKDIKK